MKTKSLIAALLLAASSAFAQVPSYVPTNGLVGWWPFNGNANDESGNGNNGTVNGAMLTSDRFGNNNKAFYFNGTNSQIRTPFNVTQLNNNYAISLWYRLDTLNTAYPALLYAYSPTSGRYTLRLELQQFNNQINFYMEVASGNPGTALFKSNVVLSGSYFHLLINKNSSFTELYLNGNLLSTTSQINPNSSSDSLYIGNNGSYQGYTGVLDDIGIWARALTQQEITALYNAQSCIGNITSDGPTTFCAGNSVNLKSDVVGGTYQWRRNGVNISTNAISRTYKASSTGTYTCVATCNGTALTSNAIAVTSKTNASATVSASGATSFCAGDSVTLNATNLGSNYSVQWYRTNISMENATNYSQVVKQPGTYKVVTRNLTNGCSRISGSAITTNVNCRTANNNQSEPTSNDINEEARTLAPELSQGVNLFPNPNNGSFKFTYEGEVEGEGTIQVISAMGQIIYQSQATAEDGRISKEIFLGDQYQKGIYIVRLLINGGQNDSRMVVQ
jgi:hypothetical protein